MDDGDGYVGRLLPNGCWRSGFDCGRGAGPIQVGDRAGRWRNRVDLRHGQRPGGTFPERWSSGCSPTVRWTRFLDEPVRPVSTCTASRASFPSINDMKVVDGDGLVVGGNSNCQLV